MPDPPDRGSPGTWHRILLGLAIGVSVSVLLLRTNNAPTTTPSTFAAQFGAGPEEGIGDQVSGFDESLVAIRRSDGRGVELLVWPLAGAPYIWDLGLGTTSPPVGIEFDRSGRQIATLLPARQNSEPVLFAGTRDVTEIVATGVTGFAWHDQRPLAFAYSTVASGVLTLWSAPSGLAPASPIAAIESTDGSLVAWGDWGFALQDDQKGSGMVVDTRGGVEMVFEGRVLATHADGMVLIDDSGLKVLDVRSGRELADLGHQDGVVDASFSPDGSQIALEKRDSVELASIDETRDNLVFEVHTGFPQISWSSSGRFLLAPGTHSIVIIDTETGKISEVANDGVFLSVAPLPITLDVAESGS